MSNLVKIGETGWVSFVNDGKPIPAGYVVFEGAIIPDPDDDEGLDTLMIWDGTIGPLGNLRVMTNGEQRPGLKKRKRRALKRIFGNKAEAIYSHIKNPDEALAMKDQRDAVKPNAQAAVSGRLLALFNLVDVYDTKLIELNALSNLAAIRNYDLQLGW